MLARFARGSSVQRFPAFRGIRPKANGVRSLSSQRRTAPLALGERAVASGTTSPFSYLTSHGSINRSVKPLGWYRFLSSGEDSAESLTEYDIDTLEYVDLVSTFIEGKAANTILIDVREPEELVESGQIPGTVNIPRACVCVFQYHFHARGS